MKRFLGVFRSKSAIHILAALAIAAFSLIVAATLAQAQTSAPLDKHARKIEKRLAKFRPGTFLDFEFRDSSADLWLSGPALRCVVPVHRCG